MLRHEFIFLSLLNRFAQGVAFVSCLRSWHLRCFNSSVKELIIRFIIIRLFVYFESLFCRIFEALDLV